MSSPDPTNPEVHALIERLQNQLNRAIDIFSTVEGSEPSDHPCAMKGNLNDLLAHNAEHEKMHLGQLSDRRYSLGLLQKSPRERYLAEWYKERANFIALLLDLPDSALDQETEPGVTTIRQIVEHVLYWDKSSVEHTAKNHSGGQNQPSGGQ
jgi:uncharacterized damage-inducible protein DinB